jgi:hypothetical protein
MFLFLTIFCSLKGNLCQLKKVVNNYCLVLQSLHVFLPHSGTVLTQCYLSDVSVPIVVSGEYNYGTRHKVTSFCPKSLWEVSASLPAWINFLPQNAFLTTPARAWNSRQTMPLTLFFQTWTELRLYLQHIKGSSGLPAQSWASYRVGAARHPPEMGAASWYGAQEGMALRERRGKFALKENAYLTTLLSA